ncbi:MAG TPA: cytochrome c family protein, partial [Methylocella sp.]|nr:cytochrome c family protein [Methylocella sp.]
MNAFELNKIAGAFLGALLFAMALNVISSVIFTPPKLTRPGYDLPSAKEAAAPGRHGKPSRCSANREASGIGQCGTG